jgi:DNA topoisomerase-1
MKHVLKSLKHNGVYVPAYEVKGFKVKIQGQTIPLMTKSEQMATAWIRKRQSASPPDSVFMRNFMREFLEQLKKENPNLTFLTMFAQDYLSRIESKELSVVCDPKAPIHSEIDFSEIAKYLEQDKQKKLSLTKETKKEQAAERKVKREALKAKYAVAEVDEQKLEIANWTAEPSCLFAGRGDHPQRGRWKDGPREEDITLNWPEDKEGNLLTPLPPGKWKDSVWEPNKMYVAKWQDKLTGKMKYVWFSDSAFLKQNREMEKFKKAETLGKQIGKIEQHIIKNLDDKDANRRKIATVCWLILKPNMRVGDEKDPDEADTVGAITLRPEHIKFAGDLIHFDFLGKDSVRWEKTVRAPETVIRNLKEYMNSETRTEEHLFEGVDSKKVSRFLSEKMPGLTAKVFRTWRCTATVKEELNKSHVTKEDPEYKKSYAAKMANLKVAEVANHKRKIPPTFDERVVKKEETVKELKATLARKKKEGKKTKSLEVRIDKAELNLDLMKKTKEYNLGTSLKSYIDPTAYVKWAKKVDFNLEKFYPKTLQKKFSWALQTRRAEAECIPA